MICMLWSIWFLKADNKNKRSKITPSILSNIASIDTKLQSWTISRIVLIFSNLVNRLCNNFKFKSIVRNNSYMLVQWEWEEKRKITKNTISQVVCVFHENRNALFLVLNRVQFRLISISTIWAKTSSSIS